MRTRKHSTGWRKLLAFSLCFVLLMSMASCGKKADQSTMVVQNAEDAIVQLAEQCDSFGFQNALSELTTKNTAQIDGDSYYRLQQYYQGIPVYGRTVVCATDKDGNVTSLTGNVMDIDSTIDLSPTVTQQEVEASIAAYLGYENTDNLQIDELTQNDLCIYDMSDSGKICLAYHVYIDSFSIVLDANNGEVLSCSQTIVSNDVSNSGKKTDVELDIQKSNDGGYILRDVTRNIYIYDAGNNTYWDPNSGDVYPDVLTLVCSEDNIFGNEDDNTVTSSTAVEYLKVLAQVCDYYKNNLKEDGYGVLVGIYNDAMAAYNGANAGGGIEIVSEYLSDMPPEYDSEKYAGKIGVITLGNAYSANLDTYIGLLGHEYTHIITQNYAAWDYSRTHNLETGAINEALSDIFGEIIEASVGNEINWEHGDRIIHNPSANEYPEMVGEKEINTGGIINVKKSNGEDFATDYAHGYSTVISHAAYLMWNGINGDEAKMISTDNLAKLWYRAMLMMPSDCDFATCRQMVEWAALSVDGLTKTQRECIGEAFDSVGIADETPSAEILLNCDRNITSDDKLLVYDVEGNLHERYTLYVSGSIAEDELAYSGSILSDLGYRYEKMFTISAAQEFTLDLPNGYYTFTVSDSNNPQYSYSFTVSVSDEGTDGNIELHTEFVNQLIVEVSGTMQTREARAGWNLLQYQAILTALSKSDPDCLMWDICNLDEDEILELYVSCTWNDLIAPVHVFVDTDVEKASVYYNISAATYTELCSVDGYGLCLNDHYNLAKYESFYDSAYYMWNGSAWDLIANLESVYSDYSKKWETTNETPFWGENLITPEEFIALEEKSTTLCELTSPNLSQVSITGDFDTILSDLNAGLRNEKCLLDSFQVDYDNDMVFETLYVFRSLADKWLNNYNTFGNSCIANYDESLLNCCDSSLTVVIAEDAGGGAVLRTFDLGAGSINTFEIMDNGIAFNGKAYAYNPVGIPFVYSANLPDDTTETTLVSDAFSDYGIRNDGHVNNYRIPKINILGEAATQTNSIIYNDIYYGVYDKIENKQGDCGDSGITYTWAEANGIVSILVEWMPEDYTGHGPTYLVTYNASAETGTLLSTEEVAQAYGFTVDEFYSLVKTKMESCFIQATGPKDRYEGYYASIYDKNYKKFLEYTLADENVHNVMPFINATGDLCIVAGIYSVMFEWRYETLLNLTGNVSPEGPAFSWDVPEESENRDEGVQITTEVTGEYFIGTVTEVDPVAIYISTAQEFVDKISADPAGSYVLACDIDLSTYNGGVWVSLEKFNGTLDGQGHVIRNLKVTSYEDAGLFTRVDGATFKDLGIEAIEVSGNDRTGVVSAGGIATFTNCYVVCPKLSGRDNVGGLIGKGDAVTVRDVFVDVSIQGNAEAYYSNIYEEYASICCAGGIIGQGAVNASNIVAHCDISITGSGKPDDGEIAAGGVVGCAKDTREINIANANVDCSISIKTARYISWKTLSSGRRSYNNVDVRAGGLIGNDYHEEGSYIQNAVKISNCNLSVDISIDAYGTPCAGGFIGYEDGYNDSGNVVTISDSIVNGSIYVLCVDGSYTKAGGIFGDHPVNMLEKNTVVIRNISAQCKVTSSGGYYTTYGGEISGGGNSSIEIEHSSIDVDLTVIPGSGDTYVDGEKQ